MARGDSKTRCCKTQRFILWSVLFLVLLPQSSAQGPTLTVDDEQGDTTSGDAAPARAPHVDILEVRLYEDVIADAIAFEFATAAEPPPVTGAGDPIIEYDAEFRFEEEWRRLRIQLTAGEVSWQARWTYQAIQEPRQAIFVVIASDDAEFTVDGVRAVIPRLVLSDVVRVEPRTTIHDLAFYARQFTTGVQAGGDFIPVGEVSDRAPNDGSLEHEITFHIQYTDDLLIYSPTMVKASNGGATTIVFPAQIRGRGPVDVNVASVPDDWSVRVPVERIEDSDINITIPIILTAVFKHRHGVSQMFEVSATNDAGTARAFFGIRYLEFPQPAGHHSRLWIHALQSGQALLNPAFEAAGNDISHMAIMTARQEYPGAESEPVAADGGHFPGVDEPAEWRWRIPLAPALAIGLDPSPNGTSTLDASFARELGAAATIVASVQVENERTNVTTVLFESEPAEASISGAPTRLILPMPSKSPDPIPFEDGNQLWLVITASSTETGADVGPSSPMHLEPGGILDLALDEYRDPITGLLPLSSLQFAPDYLEARVQPGFATLHAITLRNLGDEDIQTRMTVQATGAEVSIDEEPFRLAAGSVVRRDVTVKLIDEAALIAVAAVGDDGSIALLTLAFEADENAPQGRTVEAPGKNSPLPVILLLAAIAWATVRRRVR